MTATADDLAPLEGAGGDDDPGGQDDDVLRCEKCGEEFASKLLLGAHRFHKHGIRSATSGASKKKKAGPKRAAASDESAPESGRQARRRKAVRETLVEIVSFTDEARGRSEEEPEDLGDVIRRDADKIANSVAWIAEKFTPLGRGIDLLLGHGGPITVLRGFLGVGRWTLAHWRTAIARDRAAQEFVPPEAEEIQAAAERAYLS